MRLEFESNASAFPLVESQTVSESAPSEGEQLLRAGVKAAQEGRRSEAKALLMRVTEVEPENENAWLWLASISEYPEELLVFLNNVLRVNPENARAIEWKKATKSLLAKTLVQRGVDASRDDRKSFAKQCFEQAVEHDAENELAWLWLASVAENDAEKAQMFERVLSVNPENETARTALESLRADSATDFLNDAITEAVEGNHSAALHLLEVALEEDPALEDAWVLKAHLANSFEERAESLLKVRSLNPDNEMARACLASWREIVRKNPDWAKNDKPETVAEAAPSPTPESVAELEPVAEAEPAQMEFVAESVAAEPVAEPVAVAAEPAPVEERMESESTVVEPVREPEAFSVSSDYAAPDSPTQDLNSIPAFKYPVSEAPAENGSHSGPAVDFNSSFNNLAAEIAAEEEEMSAAFEDLHRTVTPDRDTDVEFALRSQETADPFAVNEEFAEEPEADEEWRNTSPEVFVGYAGSPAEQPAEPAYEEASAEPPPTIEFNADAFAAPEAAAVSEVPVAPETQTAQEFFALESSPAEPEVEEQVEAMPEFAPEPKAEATLCPFCNSETDKQAMSCASCCAVLGLSDLDALFSVDRVKSDIVAQAVASFEREHESYGLNPDQLANLGMGHLNLTNYRQGFLYLQEAVQRNPNNVVLGAQLNAFAIRLEEFEKVQSAHDQMAKNRRILVVDDSPTVRKLISSKLEKCGHEVVCAVDGLDALEKLNSIRPDLILLDITMPRMDGYQVCKLIRNNSDMKDVPVVMISGKDGFFDKVRGRMAGTTDYITKPFGPETLMKTVENYLN